MQQIFQIIQENIKLHLLLLKDCLNNFGIKEINKMSLNYPFHFYVILNNKIFHLNSKIILIKFIFLFFNY